MIFFTATGCWVSWSLAELYDTISVFFKMVEASGKYQTRPNAPMPTGCRSVYLIDSQLGKPGSLPIFVLIPARDFEGRAKDLGSYELRHCQRRLSIDGKSYSTEVKLAGQAW
jgi:hypothetical protein